METESLVKPRELVVLPVASSLATCLSSAGGGYSAQSNLCILVASGSGVFEVAGHRVYTLEHDFTQSRLWRRILSFAFGRWSAIDRAFWRFGLYLPFLHWIWPALLFSIRSLDPDLIDLRWMPGNAILKRKLATYPQITVLAAGDQGLHRSTAISWRRYDPSAKVSVVLPVYNGARYLRQAIESCLAQTHTNLELVIVDDGSTDETPRIIAEFAQRDDRIVTFRNRTNRGLPRALNVGFERTTGEYLTWTSCDNYYAPEAVEHLVRFLCTWPDVDFVYSACRYLDGDQLSFEIGYRAPPWNLRERNVVGSFFLYRRSVYLTLTDFREDIEFAEDYEYWVRVFKRFSMMRLHAPLYFYRRHPDRLTTRVKAAGLGERLRRRIQAEHFARHDWRRT